EKYFANKAYVSAALFYKDLKTYIYDQTIVGADLSSFASLVPISPTGPTKGAPVFPNGFLTIPLNGNGGRLDGFELTASAPCEVLADWLSGFGASVILSETDSSIKVAGQVSGGPASNTIPLPGLSKTVASATLYYEQHGFAAR